jgi:hypothetical protein
MKKRYELTVVVEVDIEAGELPNFRYLLEQYFDSLYGIVDGGTIPGYNGKPVTYGAKIATPLHWARELTPRTAAEIQRWCTNPRTIKGRLRTGKKVP